ncbi:hypothetical protein [Bradyrhizobium sp. LM6.9]
MGTLDGIIGCVAASVGLSLVPRVVASPAFAAERTGRATTVVVHRKDAFVYSARAFMECAGAGNEPDSPARATGSGAQAASKDNLAAFTDATMKRCTSAMRRVSCVSGCDVSQ